MGSLKCEFAILGLANMDDNRIERREEKEGLRVINGTDRVTRLNLYRTALLLVVWNISFVVVNTCIWHCPCTGTCL